MKKVAIQGIAGSFHHEAAEQFFGSSIEVVECQTFRNVFDAVKTNKADYGIVAVENSLHGSINTVYRLLASQKLWVCGEVRLKIDQFLIASHEIEEIDFSIIEKVYSQAPALAQCENWLDEHLGAELVETHDTAESVRHVVHYKDEPIAAIASQKAAELYGGIIIAGPINDDPHNYTRFFVISKNRIVPNDCNRTSIVLTEPIVDKVGILYDALGYFKQAGINLSKLDSHPLPGKKRTYSFYIDFDESIEYTGAKSVLKQLEKDGWSINVLGSYKQANN